MVIEDSVAGVQAALAAGMRVIGFAGGGHCGPEHAEKLRQAGAPVVIERMADLTEHGAGHDPRLNPLPSAGEGRPSRQRGSGEGRSPLRTAKIFSESRRMIGYCGLGSHCPSPDLLRRLPSPHGERVVRLLRRFRHRRRRRPFEHRVARRAGLVEAAARGVVRRAGEALRRRRSSPPWRGRAASR